MSWGTCYSGSNNIHFGFPPLMTDGRNYASWQPEAVINKTLQENADMKTNWEYRKYLVDNAQSIMQFNQLESCDQCCAVQQDMVTINRQLAHRSCSSLAPIARNHMDMKTAILRKNIFQESNSKAE